MRAVAPRVGLPELTIAEEQHQYQQITAARAEFKDGSVALVTRWRLDDEERARIAAGEDLYLSLMTFGSPMQPVSLSVGAPEWVPGEPE